MAKPRLLPFRALHYDTAKAGPICDLICPPYDVIAAEEQVWLHRQHPFNAVRLEDPLGAGGMDDSARFAAAAQTMKEWLKQGILQVDERPAIYVHRQRFMSGQQPKERWGFFCLLGLAEYSRREVLPHESTMARPKSQRTALLRICQAHFSPIMCIYQGQRNAAALLRELAAGEPLLRSSQDEHAVWGVTNPKDVQTVISRVTGPALIADGHHRYEAALAYRSEVGSTSDPGAASNYILAVLIDAYDPGLIILPAHRMIRFGPGQRARLQRQIEEHCSVANLSSLADVERGIVDGTSVGCFDTTQGYRLLTFKHQPDPTHLDALHNLLLDPSLPEEEGGSLAYLVGHEKAVRLVERGDFDAAILVAPLPASAVIQGALAGRRFPKKATYFYPKLPAGLVMSLTGPGQRVP